MIVYSSVGYVGFLQRPKYRPPNFTGLIKPYSFFFNLGRVRINL